ELDAVRADAEAARAEARQAADVAAWCDRDWPALEEVAHCAVRAAAAVGVPGGLGRPRYARDLPAVAARLRDLIGNPFRPVVAARAGTRWGPRPLRTPPRAIYDHRAFDRLPILADALEDAGCTDRDMLDHCRGPGPHVRGCWVIDLILGKQ